MEAKCFATIALLFVVAAVFISTVECTPIPHESENQANLAESMDKGQWASDKLKTSVDKGHRQGRFYGYGWPGYGYGGLGGGFGGSSATAVATATSTSTGSGYPFGK